MTPVQAMKESDRLYALSRAASARLRAIPGVGSGAMGLTPDHVKARPDYQAAKAEADRAFAELRAFNSRYSHDIAAARRAARNAKESA